MAGIVTARIPVARPLLPRAEAIAPYLARIDAARIYSNFGPLARELEARFAARHGLAPASVATVANATLALALALSTATVAPGGYCATPSWTFFATPHAIRMAGLEPYFVDVDSRTWRMTPAHIDSLPAAIRARLRAVMPVVPFSAPFDIGEWDEWSESAGVPVVVDAASAFDTSVPGRSVSVVSLHATKVLGAGEGAYAISTDAARIATLRQASGFGFDADRVVRVPGTNAKMPEYTAAVALAALDAWPENRARWLDIRRSWHAALGSAAGALFPFDAGLDMASSTLIARLAAPARDVAAAMLREGIDTRRWWNAGCAREPAFADCARGPLPVTDAIADRMLGLPMFIDMDAAAIARAARAIRPYLEGG